MPVLFQYVTLLQGPFNRGLGMKQSETVEVNSSAVLILKINAASVAPLVVRTRGTRTSIVTQNTMKGS